MDELLRRLNEGGIRYLLIGGHAMRLAGMPRFSMDWDFSIPSKDGANFARLNELLADEPDLEVVPLGPEGEKQVARRRDESGRRIRRATFRTGPAFLARFQARPMLF